VITFDLAVRSAPHCFPVKSEIVAPPTRIVPARNVQTE